MRLRDPRRARLPHRMRADVGTDNMTISRRTLAISIAVISVIGLAVGLALRLRPRHTCSYNVCIVNLQAIAEAKSLWAADNAKTNGAAVDVAGASVT